LVNPVSAAAVVLKLAFVVDGDEVLDVSEVEVAEGIGDITSLVMLVVRLLLVGTVDTDTMLATKDEVPAVVDDEVDEVLVDDVVLSEVVTTIALD